MNCKCNFAECALSYQLHEFVVVKGGWWQCFVLLKVNLIVLNKSLAFKHNLFIDA